VPGTAGTPARGATEGPIRNPGHVSAVGPFRDDALAWHGQGIQVSSSRQALARPPGDDGTAGIEARVATT